MELFVNRRGLRSLSILVALAALALCALIAPRAEAAKVGNPGAFGATVTSGTIQIKTQTFNFTDADPITFAGTIDAAGNVNIPVSGQHFPSFAVQGYPVSIIPTHPITGTVNPMTGAGSLRLRVYIKIDGVPTVPSRWLMRLDAVLQGLGLKDALTGDEAEPWLDWARERDRIENRVTIPPPAPRPALKYRPRTMSVTGIERWTGNPYAIFARNILKLDQMPPLSGEPDERLRGILIHEALTRFGRAHPTHLPDDIAAKLVAHAGDVLTLLQPHPRVIALWRPRFERFARWFAETEPGRRQGMRLVKTEVGGAHVIEAPGGPFRLTARADRIDLCEDGRLVITDYKSGAVPKPSDVTSGWSPQLPLEAAIAMAGGFTDLPAGAIAGLRYIQAGGGDPPGEVRDIAVDDLAALAQSTLEGTARLIALYDRAETSYPSMTRPGADRRFQDVYAHLARVKEWVGEDDGDA